jgi:hypothetical protein
MSEEFHRLEESLKEFLTGEQSDSYNARNVNSYKYNNLKIYMEPNQNKTPHFIIRIGISEAMYDIAHGDKLSGGLGSDEKLVRRWVDKTFVKSDLNTAWTKAQKPKTVSMQDNDE